MKSFIIILAMLMPYYVESPPAVKRVPLGMFHELVVESKRPVLVDFFASWCGACEEAHPVFEALAKQWQKCVDFREVDIDLDPLAWETTGEHTIPRFFFYKDGKRLEIDVRDEEATKEFLQQQVGLCK